MPLNIVTYVDFIKHNFLLEKLNKTKYKFWEFSLSYTCRLIM